MLLKLLLLTSFVFCTMAVSAQTPSPSPPPPPPPASYQGPVTVETTSPPSENRYTVIGTTSEGGAKNVAGGVLNGKAKSLPKPVYPPEARAANAQGAVTVQVLIDEEGNVVSAQALSGPPQLHEAAAIAARGAKFSPTKLSGQPVKVSGVITYNFVLQERLRTAATPLGMLFSAINSKEPDMVATEILNELAADIPYELNDIKELFDALAAAREIDRPEIVARITDGINQRAGAEEKWRFELGIRVGTLMVEFKRISNAAEDDGRFKYDMVTVYRELRALKALAGVPPKEIPESYLVKIRNLGVFADSLDLSERRAMSEVVKLTFEIFQK